MITEYKYTFEDLINTACDTFDLSREELLGKTRLRDVVDVRHSVMFLMLKLRLTKGVCETASIFKRNHATVVHASKKVQNMLQFDPEFATKYRRLSYIVTSQLDELKNLNSFDRFAANIPQY